MSRASLYRRCADHPAVSSSLPPPAQPASNRAISNNATLRFMRSIPIGDHSGEISAADYSPPLAADIPTDLAGLRLDQALARLFPQHSRSRLQHWVREGRVTLNDGPADPKRKVYGGERVAVAPQAQPGEGPDRAEAIALTIIHEDETLLVVDKPAGLVVHPGSGNWDGTLLN